MIFFIAVVCLMICTCGAEDCPPGEYKINALCCPMCNVGTVVKTHCTATSSSNVCVPCVAGTFMDHPNGLTKCLKCTECDTGAGLLEIKKCSYSSNTECECGDGQYCASGDSPCDLCLQHTLCGPGQYVKVYGSTKRDHMCEDCPSGHFTNTNMSASCTAWTKCEELDQIQSVEGTATWNTVCVKKRKHLAVIPSFLGFVVLLLVILLRHRRHHITKKGNVSEANPTPEVYDQFYPKSTQESGQETRREISGPTS